MQIYKNKFIYYFAIMITAKAYLNTPIGWLEISGTEMGVSSIMFIQMMSDLRSCCPGLITYMNTANDRDKLMTNGLPKVINDCMVQLDEYFAGTRKTFDIPINPKGTEFRQKVWKELMTIEYGKTTTYGEVAQRIGDGKASRAVGNANNKNRIPIIIPCHRVIGKDGKLTGYAGGLWRKKWLLDFETANTLSKL